jgi:hypothetical protein
VLGSRMVSVTSDRRRFAAVVFLYGSLVCLPLPIRSYLDDVRVTTWPATVGGYPAFHDFANLWTAGATVRSGEYAVLFDPEQHEDDVERRLGTTTLPLIWSYPPTAMIPMIPLGALPYGAAVAVWTIGSLAAYLASLLRMPEGSPGGWSGDQRGWVLAVAASVLLAPGVFLCASLGQTALVTSAILWFGLARSRDAPVLAGAALAVLVCKPQLGIPVPVALAALGAWRAFGFTALFSAAYVALTVAIAGLEPWRLFVAVTLPSHVGHLDSTTWDAPLMIAPYHLFREVGFGATAAHDLQGGVALAVLVALFVALRRAPDPDRGFLLVALAALLVSPYVQGYELPLAVLGVGRVAIAGTLGNRRIAALILAVTMGTASAMMLIVAATGVNVVAALLAAGFVVVATAPVGDEGSPSSVQRQPVPSHTNDASVV